MVFRNTVDALRRDEMKDDANEDDDEWSSPSEETEVQERVPKVVSGSRLSPRSQSASQVERQRVGPAETG